jgi:hypothetical protein
VIQAAVEDPFGFMLVVIFFFTLGVSFGFGVGQIKD